MSALAKAMQAKMVAGAAVLPWHKKEDANEPHGMMLVAAASRQTNKHYYASVQHEEHLCQDSGHLTSATVARSLVWPRAVKGAVWLCADMVCAVCTSCSAMLPCMLQLRVTYGEAISTHDAAAANTTVVGQAHNYTLPSAQTF